MRLPQRHLATLATWVVVCAVSVSPSRALGETTQTRVFDYSALVSNLERFGVFYNFDIASAERLGQTLAETEWAANDAKLYSFGLNPATCSYNQTTGLSYTGVFGCVMSEQTITLVKSHNQTVQQLIQKHGLPPNSRKQWSDLISTPSLEAADSLWVELEADTIYRAADGRVALKFLPATEEALAESARLLEENEAHAEDRFFWESMPLLTLEDFNPQTPPRRACVPSFVVISLDGTPVTNVEMTQGHPGDRVHTCVGPKGSDVLIIRWTSDYIHPTFLPYPSVTDPAHGDREKQTADSASPQELFVVVDLRTGRVLNTDVNQQPIKTRLIFPRRIFPEPVYHPDYRN